MKLGVAGRDASWRTLARRWLKFDAVGGIGIGVQLTILAGLVDGLGLDYLIATALAVEATVLHNFVWHERWTWRDRPRGGGQALLGRLIRFNVTAGALAILSNLGSMRLLVGSLHLHYFTANCLTIAACSVINFLISDRIVFSPLPRQPVPR